MALPSASVDGRRSIHRFIMYSVAAHAAIDVAMTINAPIPKKYSAHAAAGSSAIVTWRMQPATVRFV